MKPAASPLPPTISMCLGAAALLVLIQQQVLERRPPRLLGISSQMHSSGPGALDLQFSRPMRRLSLSAGSRLDPPLAHRWLGDEDRLRLLLLPGQVVNGPLRLSVTGVDRRGRRLPPQHWRWDPRPHLLAVKQVPGGEQLMLRTHEGRWQALSPVWDRIPTAEPLADGRGVVFLAGDRQGHLQLWRRRLLPRSLVPASAATGAPRLGPLERLWDAPLSFAHVSSNRRGELLLQLGGLTPGDERSLWMDPGGGRHPLPLNPSASGPIRLLPEGEGMVVPTPDGLELRALKTGDTRPQVLPGSRVLAAFCPATGQALLMRHWPDYRRSLERVQPGAAPITIWLGQEAVMAASCNQSGDRIWMLRSSWLGVSRHELVRLDGRGRVLTKRRLDPWQPEPGLPMSYDPVGDQLLLSVRLDPREPARAVLIDATSLRLRVLAELINQALWLPAP